MEWNECAQYFASDGCVQIIRSIPAIHNQNVFIESYSNSITFHSQSMGFINFQDFSQVLRERINDQKYSTRIVVLKKKKYLFYFHNGITSTKLQNINQNLSDNEIKIKNSSKFRKHWWIAPSCLSHCGIGKVFTL